MTDLEEVLFEGAGNGRSGGSAGRRRAAAGRGGISGAARRGFLRRAQANRR